MTARVHHADLWGSRQAKYDWLNDNDAADTHWKQLTPDQPFYLFVPQNTRRVEEYRLGWQIREAFPVNGTGVITKRDFLSIHITPEEAWETVTKFAAMGEAETRDYFSLPKDVRDWQYDWAKKDVLESGPSKECIKSIIYRPFDLRSIYYTGRTRGFIGWPVLKVMRHMLAGKNMGLAIGRQGQVIGSETWDIVFCSRAMTEFNFYRRGGNNLFPLYLYPEPGKMVESSPWGAGKDGRIPNLTPQFVAAFSGKLGLEFISDGTGDLNRTFGPEDVFHYAYAVFHCPTYRSRYAEFLKIDFPRLPLTGDKNLFAALVRLGRELTGLHLLEDVPTPAAHYPAQGDNVVQRVDYKPPTSESPGRVCINDEQYFDDVPPEVWAFHIGGYQVCQKWLKDRKGRTLSYDDIEHYRQVTQAVRQTLRLMEEIDQSVPAWPLT